MPHVLVVSGAAAADKVGSTRFERCHAARSTFHVPRRDCDCVMRTYIDVSHL